MAVCSFRQDQWSQPLRYRTPSPPRQFFETPTPPVSPPLHFASSPRGERSSGRFLNEAASSYHRLYNRSHNYRDSSGGELDAFASIALATTNSSARGRFNDSTRKRSEHVGEDVPQEEERPYKRVKTASYNGVGRHTTESQAPAGAGEHPKVNMSDAELLLHFSRETHSEHQRSASLVSEKMLSPTFNNRAPNTYAPVFDESPRQADMKISSEFSGRHELMQNGVQYHDETTMVPDGPADRAEERSDTRVHAPITQPPEPPPQSTPDTYGADTPNTDTKTLANGAANGHAQLDQGFEYAERTAKNGSHTSVSGAVHTSQGPSTSPITNGFLRGIEEAANSPPTQKEAYSSDDHPPTQPASAPIKMPKEKAPSVCAACNLTPDTLSIEAADKYTKWIKCDACLEWVHFGCAGFSGEREVRDVDKFRCKACEQNLGLKTTYVRKSSRVHVPVDYAGLHEGIIKTSEDTFEHHYVRLFKEGKIEFQPETFPRMRPEDITLEFFGRTDGWKRPIVIPADWNPRPPPRVRPKPLPDSLSNGVRPDEEAPPATTEAPISERVQAAPLPEQQAPAPLPESLVEDADGLDMVMPRDLTVRQVAELYGPEEKVEVIYVKSQNGEDKPWNMRRWADYYEKPGRKIIRNVISLEVSHTQLGKLIERPRIVRQLDLQDSIWPDELKAKGEYPKVQMYCLMSVADCFTDFHIDFGGSSVFYHILQGKKTFFFIPPLDKHLKKYEEWCNSPRQNEDWLGSLTKECYRVDLSAGDTMLIPAGWIHSVWTPTDSLVIGGNFLTRMHYPQQIRIAQIEKATNVARKFRYPHFQKVLWFAALSYLDEDPLPDSVRELLASGKPFLRERETYKDSDPASGYIASGSEYTHKRFYPKAELDGLPALGSYLLRTVRIAMGCINETITTVTRNAVKRSIPKGHGHGEPLDMVKKFAMWYTWKRGNEVIPDWAYPHFVPEATAPEFNEKKPSARAQKKLEREAAYQAFKVAPERQSMRARTQPQSLLAEITANQETASKKTSPAPQENSNGTRRKSEEGNLETPKKKRVSNGDGKNSSPRGRACEACRKARRGCKHRDLPQQITPSKSNGAAEQGAATVSTPAKTTVNGDKPIAHTSPSSIRSPGMFLRVEVPVRDPPRLTGDTTRAMTKALPSDPLSDGVDSGSSKPAGRAKACETCRKSKRRCIHDEFGNQDPVKLAEAAIPRPAAKKRRLTNGPESPNMKKAKMESSPPRAMAEPTAPPATEATAEVPAAEVPETHVESAAHVPVDGVEHELNGAALQTEDAHVNGATCQTEDALANGAAVQSEDAPLVNGIAVHSPTLTSQPEDEVHLISTEPLSDGVKLEQPPDEAPPLQSFEEPITVDVAGAAATQAQQIASSSLVSPPDSTNQEADDPAPRFVKATTPTSSRPPSRRSSARSSRRRSSQTSKPVPPRITPESGPARRGSVNSVIAASEGRASASPATPAPAKGVRRKSRPSAELAPEDEASMKLIRDLQAQELGLRRRGRA